MWAGEVDEKEEAYKCVPVQHLVGEEARLGSCRRREVGPGLEDGALSVWHMLQGLEEMMSSGVLAGFPVVDVRATLYDGSYHDVDSSVLAFQIAARAAFREGMRKGKAQLLEPIMKVPNSTMLVLLQSSHVSHLAERPYARGPRRLQG